MKKNLIIFSLMLVLCACLFSGCNNTTTYEIDSLNLSSQMIWLKNFDDNSGLCYDKDTKIIYIYSSNETYAHQNIVSYSPYYVMDTNNNPNIGIYNGDN